MKKRSMDSTIATAALLSASIGILLCAGAIFAIPILSTAFN
jgi:hypothetical protein